MFPFTVITILNSAAISERHDKDPTIDWMGRGVAICLRGQVLPESINDLQNIFLESEKYCFHTHTQKYTVANV